MNSEFLLYIMTAAVSITAVAFVLQAIALMKVSQSVKRMEEQVKDLAPRVRTLVETATTTVVESRKQIDEMATKVNEVLELSRKQLTTVDGFIEEFGGRARRQLDHAEVVLDDAMERLQTTVGLLQDGLLTPLRGINGLVAGFRAGIGQFLRGRRPSVAQATHDEEMFI